MQASTIASSPSSQHSPLLDNWRGWAILFVFAGHFGHVPGADIGRVGVELFFVLSGRLMADLLFLKQTPIPTFFYRRITRVMPLSLLFVFTAWLVMPPGLLHLSGKAALASAGMIINYTQLFGIGAAVTDHYWSLCVEEHSYLALAILAILMRRAGASRGTWPAKACLALAVLMVLNGVRLCLANNNYYMTYWRSDVRAASIFLSVGLRVMYLQGRLEFLRRPWVPVAAFATGIALQWHHFPDPLKYSLGSLMIAIAVNTLDDAPAAGRKFLSSKLIGWVGVISYSAYIWQQPFFYSIQRHGALPMAACAAVVSVLSFYLFENPVRTRLNQWRRNRVTRLASTGA